VGLVADHEVPAALLAGHAQFGLQVFVARKVVEARDEQVLLKEGVAGVRGVDHRPGDDLEAQVELLAHLVLPLLDEHPRADDEAALHVAADHQLLDEQAGHDRLAGAGVVGEQKVQGLAWQHLLVHRRDLMRQRHDVGGADREQRVEEVGELDAARLAYQTEEGPVGRERPCLAGGLDGERRLVVPIEDLLADVAAVVAPSQGEGLGAVPLRLHDRDRLTRDHPGDARAGRQLFKSRHAARPPACSVISVVCRRRRT